MSYLKMWIRSSNSKVHSLPDAPYSIVTSSANYFYRSLAVARIWSNNMIDVTKDQKSCLPFIFEVFEWAHRFQHAKKTENHHFKSRKRPQIPSLTWYQKVACNVIFSPICLKILSHDDRTHIIDRRLLSSVANASGTESRLILSNRKRPECDAGFTAFHPVTDFQRLLDFGTLKWSFRMWEALTTEE